MSKSLDKAPNVISEMFDNVAPCYDIVNDLSSLGMVRLWRKALVKAIKPTSGEKILDLAAGTGTSSVAIDKAAQVQVVASDLSAQMIAEGERRHPYIEFVQANATDLPFEDNSFDVVTISFGIRNIEDVQKALSEMHRVVKPGGRIIICEFSMPSNPVVKLLYKLYMNTVMKFIANKFSSSPTAYTYLKDSIIGWFTPSQLGAKMMQAGWSEVAYKSLSGGIVVLHRAYKHS